MTSGAHDRHLITTDRSFNRCSDRARPPRLNERDYTARFDGDEVLISENKSITDGSAVKAKVNLQERAAERSSALWKAKI